MAALTQNTSRHSWLTSEFLETILKSSEENENIKVIDYVLHDAVPKGENYTSYLIRVTINYADENGPKQKSFVIKTLLESEEMNEKLKKVGIFDKEITFYRDIVPKFKKYTDIIDKNFMCAPRCYATSENPTYIVFEDLKSQNYRNYDRRTGLDFNATALVLRKLAKLHAIGAMIYEESPELIEAHKVRVVSRENTEFVAIFTNGIKDVQQMCLKWPGYEHFHDKLIPFLNSTVEIAEASFCQGDNTFNTLTHGDLWVNNIMYQFDDAGNPIDVRMVDFQIGYYGPPAIDLSYLFYTSTANHVCEQDWDRLIQIYHGELVTTLKLVKYPNDRIPSLTEMQIQMLKKSLGAVLLSFSSVAPRHMDSEDTEKQANFDAMLSEGLQEFRLSHFDKPVVYERMQYLLDFYNRKGFFDIQP